MPRTMTTPLPVVLLTAAVLLTGPVRAFAQDPRTEGTACLEAGKYREAVDYFEEAVAAAPDEVEIHRQLIEAYLRYGQEVGPVRGMGIARKLMREYETVIALDSEAIGERQDLIQLAHFLPGLMGGDKERARELIAELSQLDPRLGTLALTGIQIEEGEYDQALRECRHFLQEHPGDIRIREEIGRIHHAREQWDEAFALFEEIITEAPEDLYARYLIGRSAAVSGQRLERGLACLDYFLDHRTDTAGDDDLPSAADAWWRSGMIHEHSDRTEAARTAYETALELDPHHPFAARALRKLRRK